MAEKSLESPTDVLFLFFLVCTVWPWPPPRRILFWSVIRKNTTPTGRAQKRCDVTEDGGGSHVKSRDRKNFTPPETLSRMRTEGVSQRNLGEVFFSWWTTTPHIYTMCNYSICCFIGCSNIMDKFLSSSFLSHLGVKCPVNPPSSVEVFPCRPYTRVVCGVRIVSPFFRNQTSNTTWDYYDDMSNLNGKPHPQWPLGRDSKTSKRQTSCHFIKNPRRKKSSRKRTGGRVMGWIPSYICVSGLQINRSIYVGVAFPLLPAFPVFHFCNFLWTHQFKEECPM